MNRSFTDQFPSTAIAVPTVDLHVHLRGTMRAATAMELARKNGIAVPRSRIRSDGGYKFNGFEDFLDCYHEVGSVVTTAVDLAQLAEHYLLAVAQTGTIYVEFMLSPDHSIDNGIPYLDQIHAVAAGVARAKAREDINAGIVVTCVRHRGPKDAARLARLIADEPHPLVVGFGMTGNENLYEACDFAEAFSIAGAAGLGLTAHAGEWRGGQTVVDAVDCLGLSRVGHGLSLAQDPQLLKLMAQRGLGFEVCLSSNLELGAVPSLDAHPVGKMLDAGCRVTLCTDDPSFFETSPENETRLAQMELGLGIDRVLETVQHGIDMAFCDMDDKRKLTAKVRAFWSKAAGRSPSGTPELHLT